MWEQWWISLVLVTVIMGCKPNQPQQTAKPKPQSPIVKLLASIPGVAEVEVRCTAENPKHQIVHIKNWHFIPKDLFAADFRSQDGAVTNAEVEQAYSEFIDQVETVQSEQLEILRTLAKEHELTTTIFVEGMTEKDVPHYNGIIDLLQEFEKNDIPKFKTQRENTLAMKKLLSEAEQEDSESYHKAQGILGEVENILYQHQLEMLRIGATGKLYMEGVIEEILPLEQFTLACS